MMCKILFIVFLLVSGINFWSYIYIDVYIYKMISLINLLIVILCLLFEISTLKKDQVYCSFRKEVLFILFIVFVLNPVGAYLHGQSFIDSFQVSRIYLFYLLYFLLHYWNISSNKLLNIMIYIGFVWCVIMYLQQFTHVKLFNNYTLYITDDEKIIDTNTVSEFSNFMRILPDGNLFGYIFFFSFIFKYIKYNYKRDLLISLFAGGAIYLQFTRSVIIGFLICLMILLFTNSKYKKSILSFVILVVVVFIFEYDLLLNPLVEKTVNQEVFTREYSRWRSMFFFLFDYWESWIMIFIGNGSVLGYMSNPYGVEIQRLSSNGLIWADIGKIGVISQYGIFMFVVILMIYKKVIIDMKGKIPFVSWIMFLYCLSTPLLPPLALNAIFTSCLFYIIDKQLSNINREIISI